MDQRNIESVIDPGNPHNSQESFNLPIQTTPIHISKNDVIRDGRGI
jgi:hypothetical protein